MSVDAGMSSVVAYQSKVFFGGALACSALILDINTEPLNTNTFCDEEDEVFNPSHGQGQLRGSRASVEHMFDLYRTRAFTQNGL